MGNAEALRVEVTYARPDRQVLMVLQLPPGATLEQAIRRCGVLTQFPEIDLKVNPVGVFGRRRTLDAVLRDGDRVEIYRPLVVDPKEARRRRAAQGKRGAEGQDAE
ncbi:MAG: RnfH family protein [Chromatiales bacterium 21-64-14]|nr:MAG: RnfH family protein [Chromatiales bacterium 21-64-14]HQU16175.1 RnfH family protein [Gammaproteobacteria bacterium]